LKSASKMGSSTSFRLAWTTRSAIVGTVTSYCLSLQSRLGWIWFVAIGAGRGAALMV
jgi:hypothetical protein